MQSLEPGQLWLMRIVAWGGCLAAVVASLVAEVVNARLGFLPGGLIAGVVALLCIYPAFLSPKKHFRAWRWRVEADELHIHHGVWTRVETLVPFVRVQHIDVSQNALERAFGVTSLVLHTAGTLNSKVVLPGLARETAEALRDQARAVILQVADDH